MENTETKKENIFVRIHRWNVFTWKWLFDMKDWKLLLRSVPGLITALLVVSVVIMNLMASKVIISTPLLGITGAIFFSWIPFLCMDVLVKIFGARAATKLNILAMLIDIIFIGLFQLITMIEVGTEGMYDSFNEVYSQTWQIVTASALGMLISGIFNNRLNQAIGYLFKKNPDGKLAYVTRSYISTFFGQFVDNFVFYSFAFLIFYNLSVGTTYGYTLLSVTGSSVLGGILELLMEVVFSPGGYLICKKWKEEKVGEDYLNYASEKNYL